MDSTKTTMHIPSDVMFEIFSKLSAKSLLRFRWICKYWFKVITDPDFVKMHFNHVNATNNPLVMISSYIARPRVTRHFHSLNSLNDAILHPVKMEAPLEFTPLGGVHPQILGSCNGLLCIGCFGRTPARNFLTFIWNPCTKQYKRIIFGFEVYSKIAILTRQTSISYGFGYDSSTNDYKVIRNVCSLKDNDYNGETLIDVHTLGTSSSKTLIDNNRFFLDNEDNEGVFINGDLFWKANLTGLRPFNIIVAFDVAKEEYRQITSKPYINHEACYSMHLRNLKGCLCVLKVAANYTTMEIWVMNHNIYNMNTDENSWDLLYTISAPWSSNFKCLYPLMFCRNGELAMSMNSSYSTELFLHDPKDNRIRFHAKVKEMTSVENYIESLVPVKGGTYIDEPPCINATDKPKRRLKRPAAPRFEDFVDVLRVEL